MKPKQSKLTRCWIEAEDAIADAVRQFTKQTHKRVTGIHVCDYGDHYCISMFVKGTIKGVTR